MGCTEEWRLTPGRGRAGDHVSDATDRRGDRRAGTATDRQRHRAGHEPLRRTGRQLPDREAGLQAQGLDEQILGRNVFTPPWSTTAGNPAVPDRYRIRVLRDITVQGFTAINRQEWATYELAGQLGTAGAAIDYANQLFTQADYNSRATINAVLDYSIEQV